MEISRHVLIVEDDVCTRALLGAVVQYYGFQPSYAPDGKTALGHVRTTGTGVLILDLLLPHVNGFEVLREVKCTTPSLLRRTIVITAVGDRTLRDCEELRLVRTLLRKPVDVGQFADELLASAALGWKVKAGSQEERETG